MVKFGKHKLKKLNKAAKKQIASPSSGNKVLKKKLNIEKKVTFQIQKKEALLKETVKSEELVQNLSKTDIALRNLFKKPEKTTCEVKKPKIKAVEKQKKRQKTQISDTKLLLNLMKKKS